MNVKDQIGKALRRDPNRVALEYRGEEIHCGRISGLADSLIAQLHEAGVPQDAPVAVVARNRPAQAAAVLGLVEAGRTVSNVYAFQSPDALAADLARTGFAAVVAEEQDWTPPVVEEARRTGTVGVVLRWGAETSATTSRMRSSMRSAARRVRAADTNRRPRDWESTDVERKGGSASQRAASGMLGAW